ncbi:hypothetical protein N836_14395 [Leptolyngbya sp. Heron Island J]|uniref:LmeA family phospholipid-binding protein n=1 Tax=Leptolyngbya sp. Heron Island J TaxID=1385935 RepID=UPI0003B949C2|nr:DUF2993 domain-containing protein [Leptolyngbya sp. Heron Island J]ESA34947.1 hypothetical protein N836_14395 [Leptolyngbya sp. Heron Island J]
MEFISILLSSLLFIGSPIGFGLDTIAENAIRSRLDGVEDVQVRVDNGSNLNLLKGKIDRLQVGVRGLYPVEGFRVAIADLETDPIDLDFSSLRRGNVVLDQPLNGALHIVITPEDLNQYLLSPEFTERLNNIQVNLGNAAQNREVSRYQFSNPNATFLPDNQLQLELDLADPNRDEVLNIKAQTSFTIENGHRLILVNPQVSVNDSEAPEQLLDAFTENLGDRLSLRRLEDSGITTRILDASISPEQFDLVMWVSIDPSFTQ